MNFLRRNRGKHFHVRSTGEYILTGQEQRNTFPKEENWGIYFTE